MSETELIEAPERFRGTLQAADDGWRLTPDLVKEVKAQVALRKEMTIALLQMTEPDHWRDMGGKPYPEDGAIQVMAVALGVQFSEPEITREEAEDEKGKLVRFICKLSGSWRGRSKSDFGEANTRDGLYTKKASAEVEGDVRKHSITNAEHRVLVKLTGLVGVTWAMLDRAGVKRGAGGTIRYKGTEGRMTTGAGEWTPKKERIWGLLLELNNNDETAATEHLCRLTENKSKGWPGKTDPAQLTEKGVEFVLPRLEQAYAESQAPAQQAPEREPGQEG